MGSALSGAIASEPCPKCYLCGTDGAPLYSGLPDRLFGTPGVWSLKQCPSESCGLVWLDPMPTIEEIGKAYIHYYTHEPRTVRNISSMRDFARRIGESYLWHKYGYPSDEASSWIDRLWWLTYLHPGGRANLDFGVFYLPAKPNGRVLEIGFGAGELLQNLQARGWSAEGIDTDAKAVAAARDRGLKAHLGTLAEQRFSDAIFDAIVMSHLIEHVHDPIGLLKECRRVLTTHGSLVLVTPNIDSLAHRIFDANWLALDPPRHLHLFSSNTLIQVVERAGLRVRSCRTTIRDANGLYIASKAIRRKGFHQMGAKAKRWLYYQARLFQLMEWGLKKFRSSLGEEIVLIASR